MAEHYRKIELFGPEDLQYLITNVRRAANEKIEKDLPPLTLREGEKDEFRSRVEELVHEFITAIFTGAAPNISINGLDVNPSIISSVSASEKAIEVEEFEPIDTKMHERARGLIAEEEELIEEIARLRREMPAVAVESTRREYKEGIEKDELLMDEAMGFAAARVQRLDMLPLERQEDVERSWGAGVRGVQSLSSELPGIVAKTERAQKAGDHVVAPERKG